MRGHESVEVTPPMLKKSCRVIFKFPVLAHSSPHVNYGSSGSSGKKGKLRSSSWKGKSAKESPHSISCKQLVLFSAPIVDEVARFG